MSTESNFDDFAIKTLQNYNVKITINRDLQENRGYVSLHRKLMLLLESVYYFNLLLSSWLMLLIAIVNIFICLIDNEEMAKTLYDDKYDIRLYYFIVYFYYIIKIQC